MQQEQISKNKTCATIFWALSAICMGLIFYFSSREASESSLQSVYLLELLQKIFGDSFLNEHIVRKLAHFSEYAGLCIMLNSALVFTKGKKQMLIAICISSLYSVTDEIHQIFVEGRSCQFVDWLIDTSGAITGAIAFLIIFLIINKMAKKGNKIWMY